MTPWLDDGDVRLFHGDALETLRGLPDGSVDCVVTSPPYWGLRDYSVEGQLGLEPTPDLFVQNMVSVFREVRRVLAAHGTCWVNLGDSYAQSGGKLEPEPLEVLQERAERKGYDVGAWGAKTKDGQGIAGRAANTAVAGLKPKDLCGIPWRVAFALQADGWWLRSDIIWAKPNPMPESVTDRPTKAHEYVFLLTKQPRYWFDTEAVREPHTPDGRHQTKHIHATDNSHPNYDNVGNGNERWPNGGRNVRSVWQIATQPYPEAHFATFPEELARRCILAGCPVRVCRVCGRPSERLTTVERHNTSADNNRVGIERPYGAGHGGLEARGRSPGWRKRPPDETVTVGWSDCGHNNWRPGQVLDPFMGSGTVAKVARDHQRHAIGIDLNETYLQLAARRLQQLSLLTGADA